MPFWSKKKKSSMSSIEPPVTVPVGSTVKCRMTDIVDDDGVKKRVITGTVTVQIKNTFRHKGKRFFQARVGIPGMDWGAFYLDPKALDKNGEITYDRNYCEPITPKDSKVHRSFEVSIVMANAFMVQGIEIATILSQFVFTRRHALITACSITLFGLAFWSLAPLFHFVPNVNIHYVPSLPKVVSG